MSEYADEYQTSILTKEGLFTLKQYKDEKELERLVVSNAAQIFGSNSIYFDIKQKVKSVAKAKITDGLLLDLENKMFWVVENELSRHDPYSHIQIQIEGFIRALSQEDSLAEIANIVFNDLQGNKQKLRLARKTLGKQEVYLALRNMLRNSAGVLIVIDKITPEVEDVKDRLADNNKIPTKVIEFKTYEKDSKLIFAFAPLAKVISKTKQKANERDTWAKQLTWASPSVQNLTNGVIRMIEDQLDKVYHKPYLSWYAFYCKDTMQYDSFFAVMLPRKHYLRVRFCLPSSFKEDKRGLLKKYKGWFFTRKNQQELGIRIDGRSTWSFEDQAYFKECLKEAYDFALHRMKVKDVGR